MNMDKDKKIAAIIFGAAAALALYKFFQMPKEEREALIAKLKQQTEQLLDDADHTVEKVQHYMSQMTGNQSADWFDKFYLVRQMFNEFYTQPLKSTTPSSNMQG